MTAPLVRTRVALAAFDHGVHLAPALIDLETARFDVGQLGTAARASAFAALKHQYAAGVLTARVVAPLVLHSLPLDTRADVEAVRISLGTFWPALNCFGSQSSDQLVTAPWMAPRLRDELGQYLKSGAILLGVGAISPEQQRCATQILLENCSHRVHTHDFRH